MRVRLSYYGHDPLPWFVRLFAGRQQKTVYEGELLELGKGFISIKFDSGTVLTQGLKVGDTIDILDFESSLLEKTITQAQSKFQPGDNP